MTLHNPANVSDVSVNSDNHIAVSVDFSNATWNTAASHEVFDVTGLVRMRIWIECDATLTDAANGAAIQFGFAGATNALIASTDSDDMVTGELWYDATPTTTYETTANAILDYVSKAIDVGYEITGEALLTGTIVFHCAWDALNATGAVAAGAGGSL